MFDNYKKYGQKNYGWTAVKNCDSACPLAIKDLSDSSF
jgi:hypothetical protein